MKTKPTYAELERRVAELERMIAGPSKAPEPFFASPGAAPSPAPENDLPEPDLNLSAIIDTVEIQYLMDRFYDLTKFGMAILDLEGNVLVSTGWQEICSRFHRAHPETAKNCRKSDLELSNGVEPGTFRLYKCKNNMWDIATPIVLGGKKYGNLYLGQFLFEDEPLDIETFRRQAKTYGFDEAEYIAALRKVPRRSRRTVDTVIEFYATLANLISRIGYTNCILHRTLAEKNRLLESLHESGAKYRDLVENLNDVIYTIDTEGIFTYASPPIEPVLGYSPAEIIGMNFSRIIHPDDLGEIRAAFQDVLSNRLYPNEYRMRTRNGTYKWIRSYSRPIVAGDQNIGVQGVLTDIDQRRQAEDALRVSEEKFFRAFRNAPVLMTISEIETGRYLEVNDAFVRISGYSREETIGTTAVELGFISPEGRKRLLDILYQKGRVRDLELELARADGSKMICLYSGEIIELENQKRLLSIGSDITGRIVAEQRLRESKEQFQKIFNSQLDAIFLLDAGSPPIILESNRAASVIFGHKAEELLGKTTGMLHVDGAWLKRFHAGIADSLEKTGFMENFEFSMKRKDGSVFPTEHTVLALKNNAGEQTGSLSIVRDLTEQKEMRRRLEQAQKLEALGTLSGGIAHDFNNILFPLLGHAEMLKMAMPAEPPLHHHADVIIDSTLRARDLVKQILAFSRQGEQEIKPIRLQPILKEAMKLMRATIPTIIDFKTHIDPACGIVMADPTQIHQIIMNLTTNAFHAMEETGGQLRVSYRQISLQDDPRPHRNLPEGDYALLTVADTGIGIQQEIIDKVFDPFFTTKEKHKGTGLGLSVVRGIVEHCGGEIHIDSKWGRGTDVQVWLPIADCSPPETGDDQACPVSGGTERILLVDDDENVVRMIQTTLEGLGYRVTAHTGSTDALKAFKADPEGFDLVYSDVTMPRMTGDQLARKIRKIRAEIPIILSTGFSDKIDSEKCKEMGIRGFVMKPVNRQKIAETVRRVLDESLNLPDSGPETADTAGKSGGSE